MKVSATQSLAVLIAVGCLVAPGLARASITASYSLPASNAGAGSAVTSPSNSTSNGGRFQWTVAGGGNAAGLQLRDSDGNFSTTSFMSFCIELTDTVGGGNITYDVVTLDSAPRPLPLAQPMGVISAARMQKLWNVMLPSVIGVSSNTLLGAAQMAIWELVYDTTAAKPSVINTVGKGNFYATAGNSFATATAEAQQAQTWLDIVWADEGLDLLPRANLMALSSYVGGDAPEGVQDQVVEIVPEPASIAVWSVLAGGAAGLSVAKRRRRAASAGRWTDESRSEILALVNHGRSRH
jgi:hypothetical protein